MQKGIGFHYLREIVDKYYDCRRTRMLSGRSRIYVRVDSRGCVVCLTGCLKNCNVSNSDKSYCCS